MLREGEAMLVTDAVRTDALGFYEHLGYHPDRYWACKKYLDASEGQRSPHASG